MQGGPPQLPFGYEGREPPPPGLQQPQFHLFPSNFPNNNAFVPSPTDIFLLQNQNIFFPNAHPFHAHGIPFQNPTFHGQNNGFQPQQNTNFHQPQVPSVQAQNSGFQSQEQASNHTLGVSQPRPNYGVTLERVSEEVVKARREITAGGNSVSAWKVSQSVLLALRSDSWESLGFQMQEVPPLHSILVTERKINSFIQCFIGVRSITTLYELELAICENEGVEHFEELDLGPFLRHPLVIHYFSLSSNVKEVSKVTSGDILSSLHTFLNNHQYNEAQIDELLCSIIEKALTSSEKLNVRIQSLGKHITCIRKALQSENVTLKKYVDGLKQKFGLKVRKRPLFSSQKRKLDDRFKEVSQQVESFASANIQFCGKHTRFSASFDDNDLDITDYEDDKTEHESQSYSKSPPKKKSYSKSSQNSKLPERVSNCPYPSATEEILRLHVIPKKHSRGGTDNDDGDSQSSSRTSLNAKKVDQASSSSYHSAAKEMMQLGLKPEKCDSHSSRQDKMNSDLQNKKRKFDQRIEGSTVPLKIPKKREGKTKVYTAEECLEPFNEDTIDPALVSESTRMFLATWKETCCNNSAKKVVEMMLQLIHLKQKKKFKAFLLSYPFAGLIDLAMNSIKCGFWDSMYDAFQKLGCQGTANNVRGNQTVCTSMEVETDEDDERIFMKNSSMNGSGVDIDDIIKKILSYFKMEDDSMGCAASNIESRFSFLRKLCSCESWINAEFSVKEFQCFGYGDFMTFLEQKLHLLPSVFQKSLVGGKSEQLRFEACMLPLQLEVLLSQASTGVWQNHKMNNQMILKLLGKQFPSFCFKPLENNSSVNFCDTVKFFCPKSVLFSATLLKESSIEDFGAASDKSLLDSAAFEVNIEYTAGNLRSVSTKDAIDLLSKAPLLMDLETYSHWDFLYAPSLGPLVGWLLNEVNSKDLLCLVCKGGKVIRLDHLATIDSVLEVMIEGSAIQTAVKLLSLLALYGGELDAQLSLLKSHTQIGLQGLMHNAGKSDLDDFSHPIANLKSARNVSEQYATRKSSNDPLRDTSTPNKGLSVASRFILDCLGFLPAEFCSFAGRILLAGFQSFVKDAPSVILSECKQVEHRVILHDMGFSLGITEWITDYHACASSGWANLFPSEHSFLKAGTSIVKTGIEFLRDARRDCPPSRFYESVPIKISKCEDERDIDFIDQVPVHTSDYPSEATSIVESIRRDEFGLDSGISVTENKVLKKQHARLGRALHCLSHELYSQDSHFLLELVQNADDNMYPQDIEPTLVFILHEKGIVILNNEIGFSAENIKSICDIGNSTKKGGNAGYIGKKGIGFKSVFRVTDAPEIHSNGFHIKFDTTEGEIGFVLPTPVPPCDIGMYTRLVSMEFDHVNYDSWRTCIVLPLKGNASSSLSDIMSVFSDLHPSLLLFLHRLKCIKFRNLFSDSLVVMKKEVVTDGIIKISNGMEHMFWLVASQKLQAESIRSDIQSTEISVAFTLEEMADGGYIPHLSQQPVFAFLPLRTYGLKFIIQGDFVLPSSREEVDGDSPWNQWLLTEFPGLFVTAEKSFCELPCFSKSPGKAVTAFMSFVPLIGEVHGFFSCLPRMIISKLRMSDCLLLEGDQVEWVPPCKVLRNWSIEARILLPDKLLREHLGLGFLNKDIVLADSLSRALGVEEYGPKTLVNVLLSLSRSKAGLENMGLQWLSAWINSIYLMSLNFGNENDLISNLRKVPFIPLSDGEFGSVEEGTIWLHSGISGVDECTLKGFSKLYAKLRTVTSDLFSAAAVEAVGQSCSDTSIGENITKMLLKLGVQRLSGHEIVKVHILPTLCNHNCTLENDNIIAEYLAFIMLHLESGCQNCDKEDEWIMGKIRSEVSVLTNFGCKRFNEVPIHFSKEFGNPIDVKKLICGTDVKWYEIDNIYMRHPATKSKRDGVMKWRKFFQVLGVTDFVQVINSEKRIGDVSDVCKELLLSGNLTSMDETVNDWESPELVNLLSTLSYKGDQEKCKYMLEILDSLWDDCFSNKANGCLKVTSSSEGKYFKSSLVSTLQNIRWMVSTVDSNFYFPKDLFHDCEAVRSILGVTAPYSAHKVVSQKLLESLGLKSQVMLDDVLLVLRMWRKMEHSFKASISQMTKLYTIIWTEMAASKEKIVEGLSSGPFIFVPCTSTPPGEVVPGFLLSPREVYWHDITGSIDQIKLLSPKSVSEKSHPSFGRMLHNFYPTLCNFFVNECGVDESPPLSGYLQILQHLSTIALPSQAAAKTVFRVLSRWADGLLCGSLRDDDVEYLRESLLKKECAVLPTVMRWVSLHPSFGLICWSDDGSLRMQFNNLEGINFLYFGDLTDMENKLLQNTIASLFRRLKIPALSAVVCREAIYYGPSDSTSKALLVRWALPYAQRYMCYFHPDKYNQLKSAEFENMTQIQIVVVEKLFYRNVIKGCQVASRIRLECSCLLEGKTFYTTREADSHSVFMELSRRLFGEAPELHLANFLQMITTMVEAGSTKEQTEFFVVNSQKLPKLPDEESVWSISNPITLPDTTTSPVNNTCTMLCEESKVSSVERKPDSVSSSGYRVNADANTSLQIKSPDGNTKTYEQEDHVAEIEMVSSWNYEKGQQEHSSRVIYSSRDTEDSNHQSVNAGNMFDSVNAGMASFIPGADLVFDSVNVVTPAYDSSCSSARMKQNFPISEQAVLTGRLGEFVAFKYFVDRVGEKNVNWVNEKNETGLPYDLIIGGEEGSQEYVEVKATQSSKKNWFDLSFREWQFAAQKGESFSVAHVLLLGNNTSKVTIFKNLTRLCQLSKVRLAVMMSNIHTMNS